MNVLGVLVLLFSSANAAKILCIFPGVAHSHYTIGYTLVKALARKGHEVTFLSPFEEKGPVKNLKNVVLTGLVETAEEMMKDVNLFDMGGSSPFLSVVGIGSSSLLLAEKTLSNEALQAILKSNENFDLVILESFIIDSLQAIPYHYNVPCVLLSTIGPSIWTNHIVGIPDIPSFMPSLYLNVAKGKMSFFARVYNTMLCLFQKLFDHIYFYPKHNQLVKKYFPESPNIYDLVYNTSLMLVNSHVSFNTPLPTTANMIEIGGYHIDPPTKLPADLQKILDESKTGAIYFSMGSNLKAAKLYPELREAVLNVLGKLNHTVLWKFEDDKLPGKPDNVIIRKWFPQNDILAHPNVNLFITHGGLLSTMETIYHGVPIVAIPVFGDQYMNSAAAVDAGYAVQIPFEKLTMETFEKALYEVLSNPRYLNSAKERSKIFHDQEIKPIDKATYWIEYVIRHKGAPHLRSPGLHLSAYQYYLVDVITFLILITISLFLISFVIIKRMLGRHGPPKQFQEKFKVQ